MPLDARFALIAKLRPFDNLASRPLLTKTSSLSLHPCQVA